MNPTSPSAIQPMQRPGDPAEPALAGPRQVRIGVAAGADVVEAERHVREPDEHHDLRRDARSRSP